jgi:hypothetical protein
VKSRHFAPASRKDWLHGTDRPVARAGPLRGWHGVCAEGIVSVSSFDATPRLLVREELDRLIDDLRARGYLVIGPRLGEGAIVQGEIRSTSDLPVG